MPPPPPAAWACWPPVPPLIQPLPLQTCHLPLQRPSESRSPFHHWWPLGSPSLPHPVSHPHAPSSGQAPLPRAWTPPSAPGPCSRRSHRCERALPGAPAGVTGAHKSQGISAASRKGVPSCPGPALPLPTGCVSPEAHRSRSAGRTPVLTGAGAGPFPRRRPPTLSWGAGLPLIRQHLSPEAFPDVPRQCRKHLIRAASAPAWRRRPPWADPRSSLRVSPAVQTPSSSGGTATAPLPTA